MHTEDGERALVKVRLQLDDNQNPLITWGMNHTINMHDITRIRGELWSGFFFSVKPENMMVCNIAWENLISS